LNKHDAADIVVSNKLPQLGGDGGVIVLDTKGNFHMTFCTDGMYRGFINSNDKPHVFIYQDEIH